jgi:hypothetical protein
MKHLTGAVSVLACICLSLLQPARAAEYHFTLSASDIQQGYVIRQIPLETYGMPAVIVGDTVYTLAENIPKHMAAAQAGNLSVDIGMEQKSAFALLRIPAYRKADDGSYRRLISFTVNVLEAAAKSGAQNGLSKAAKTSAVTSPLATGTWYKIAVPARGMYKLDAAFLQHLGISTGSINPANIRVLGNGGALLSENNAVPRPLQLRENAIWVSDGGDGRFDNDDFAAFYAPGPTRWDKDSVAGMFHHVTHLYADSSYYFISVDAGPGLRVSNADIVSGSNRIVTSFNDYAAHEKELYNPGAFGKEWWGEKFGITADALSARDISFPLGGTVDSLHVSISAAARSTSPDSRLSVSLNGADIAGLKFDSVDLGEDRPPVSVDESASRVWIGSNTANFRLSYTGIPDAIGYLNYIELNWRRQLAFAGSSFSFRDWQSVAPGAIAEYRIDGATSATQVWDVSDPMLPVRMNGSLNGDRYSFVQSASFLHEFVAIDGKTWASPVSRGNVANQDLHGAGHPQFVIVTHPDFLAAANRLADHHRQQDGMRVLVATTDQVYNEFSSGSQDISGIRDMMRYFYLDAGTDSSLMPRYLLLFGDASYDYKSRIPKNSNYVPTFESPDGVDAFNAYTVDDFFGFLDDNENMSDFRIVNTLDIGVGRLPVSTTKQAEASVDKIIAYRAPASFGPWRLTNTYVADNDDNEGMHPMDAEDAAAIINAGNSFTNDAKIYLDNLPFVSTPGGARCPDANKAINDQIFNGTFLINYTGHGSIATLAHERILTQQDFNQWKNMNKLPFMVTATCSYARYDNPAYTSNGESLILKENGGTIAMLTTTGPVYAQDNRLINQQFLAEQYTKHNGSWPTFGDAIRAGKNTTFKGGGRGVGLVNFYRFSLLGDPALQPAFPKHLIHSDSIVDLSTGKTADTIRALGRYSVSGHLTTEVGGELSDFNGRVFLTIYDKPRIIDLMTRAKGRNLHYDIRENLIFNGIATVTNGRFSCAFIAPKDMIYDYGNARISYYAENGKADAAGVDTSLKAGSFFDGAPADNDAPIVKPYIGDTLFRDGGITGSNTLLYVSLADSSGINVSGTGVGHDISAVLDGDEARPFILNKLYQSEQNTYQRGHLSFPLNGLSDGLHTITVKAWDVYNNSGTGSLRFRVADGKVMQLENLQNYPNPFTENTHFVFDYNHPLDAVEVQLQIFDMRGMQVRTFTQAITPGASRNNELIWDGTAENGSRLGSGVYPYRVTVRSADGIIGSEYQKLVIVR